MEFISCLSLIPLALGSIRTYVSGIRHHLKIFLLPDFSYNKSLDDLSEQLLMEFISCLSLIPLALGSIQTYVSGIRHHLKICLLPDFSSSFLIALTLKGVTSPECQDDVCLPISLHVLHLMCNALHHITHAYNAALFKAILGFGFFTLLRPGELTDSQHVIHMVNIHLVREAIFVKLPMSKCHKFDYPQVIKIMAQPYVMCPVCFFQDYIQL